ncbi:mitogen-activated protein kinase kinase kinase 15 [Suncus etruscus]|uniref:mitogen-activated protein kinase kinase kinase 15 n=1 Tax=Suncus etruscus TaxID=109475 RepID=UPI00210FDEDC|nr:mitogen-activated protein kinase kinase kinase 15 [Suncus etruscus]
MEKPRELGARRKVRDEYPRKCMASTVAPSTIYKDTLVTSAKKGGHGCSLRVLYVHSRIDLDQSQGPETGVQTCLKKACLAHGACLGFMLLEELELEDPGLLEAFYTADIAVAVVSDLVKQYLLFYHLGIRESFNMTNNVILYYNTDINTAILLEEFVIQKNKVSSGGYYFVPYIITSCKEYICYENNIQRLASQYKEPGCKTNVNPLCVSLVDKFSSLLVDIYATSCYFKPALLKENQKARNTYQDDELVKELTRIKLEKDSLGALTIDFFKGLMMSYRDVQDYDSMIKLVESLARSPVCSNDRNSIGILYAFALNRRKYKGDNIRALRVMLKILENSEYSSSDMLCLCGRIYRDLFFESKYTDRSSRDNAIKSYRQGFNLEPDLSSGINLVVLLLTSGQKFETSSELKKIGVFLNNLLGTKGKLDKMNNYWDVGYFFKVTMLNNDFGKAVQAAERLFTLNAPEWYLRSLFHNFILIYECIKTTNEYLPKQEQLDFWLDILFEAPNRFPCGTRFPVLVIVQNNVYQPSYVSINSGAENIITLKSMLPKESKEIYEWNFTSSSVKAISISRLDERCCFLYVYDNDDDFQIYFSTKDHCSRFFTLVRNTTPSGNVVGSEEDTDGDIIEYAYELDAQGHRIILGKGTYGIVYTGMDLNKQVKIAIKEVSEVHTRQSLREELSLHKYLKHSNIVQYLGYVCENGYIKIFMEQVPGGTLSDLLLSKWGPLKEPTIKFYTKQILEGLEYLHKKQIIHRDIKGGNILVNIYSGVVKIADFGASKHISQVSSDMGTIAGTLQYMAPEIIGQYHGYTNISTSVDIWSLACTVVEMATGRPPFSELGESQAVMFQLGMCKSHPEIPRSLSSKARAFILPCFELNPTKRPTATQLLKDKFLRQKTNKTKKYQSMLKPSGYPFPEEQDSLDVLTLEALSINNEVQLNSLNIGADPEVFHWTDNSKYQQDQPLSVQNESLGNQNMSKYLNPEEGNPDHSVISSDSDRRYFLYKILRIEQNQMVFDLQAYLIERSEEVYLSADNIKKIIGILTDFIYSQNNEMLVSTMAQLKIDLDLNSSSIDQVYLILFAFQEADRNYPQILALLTNIHFSFHDFSAMNTGSEPVFDPAGYPSADLQDNQAQAACGQGDDLQDNQAQAACGQGDDLQDNQAQAACGQGDDLQDNQAQAACGQGDEASGFSLEYQQQLNFELLEMKQTTSRNQSSTLTQATQKSPTLKAATFPASASYIKAGTLECNRTDTINLGGCDRCPCRLQEKSSENCQRPKLIVIPNIVILNMIVIHTTVSYP